ncbi:hypothetical protein B0H13DRAFT_1895595, partial [Mycena leptocephala]
MVHPSLPRIGDWADDGRWGNVNLVHSVFFFFLAPLFLVFCSRVLVSLKLLGGGDFDDYDGPTLTPGDDENPLHHDHSFSQPLLPDADWEDLVDNPVAAKRKADSFKDDSAQAIKRPAETHERKSAIPVKSTASRRKILQGPVSDCYQKNAVQDQICAGTSARKASRIAESVENILSRNTGADQIFWTVASLVDTPRQWNDTDDDSALIPEADFIDHILLSYLTLCLISDDLQIDFLRAIKVLEESDAFGK